MNEVKNIISGFDILKFIMAIVIINMHAGIRQYVDDPILDMPWRFFNNHAVPIFFILSSYFFFKKARNVNECYGGGCLRHYEVRLLKLYGFWIIALFPTILFIWHKEYMDFSAYTIFYIVRDFFLGGLWGGSWFFGALIVGVPLIYLMTKVMDDRLIWIIPFIIYLYVFIDCEHGYIYDWYYENVKNPRWSVPAGLFWISLGYLLSNDKIANILEKTPLWASCIFFVMGSVLACFKFDVLFRIPVVLSLIMMFYKIKAWNASLSIRLRMYSIHFYCLHLSVIRILDHYFTIENRFIIFAMTLFICWMISETMIRLMEKNDFKWLKYSM